MSTPGVRLELPCDTRSAFAARTVAAWLVSARGAPLNVVEDARLAIDEAVTPVLTTGQDTVTVDFEPNGQEFQVTVTAGANAAGAIRLTPLAARILSVVTNGLTVNADGTVSLRVRTE